MRRATWDTLPDEVEQVRARFAQWRQARPGRSRIPRDLWSAAADLARRHGVHPVARTLGLNDHSLRQRLRAPEPSAPRPAPAVPPTRTLAGAPAQAATEPPLASGAPTPAFVELPWPAPPPAVSTTPAPRCLIELRQPGGAQMTITLEGSAAPAGLDLAALARAFWSRPA